MTVLTTPYALGAGGQVLSGKLLRLSLGATFQPSAGVTAVSGVLAGPANTMGELSLVSNTQLTVQAFRAVVQATQDATAGQYVVPNDGQVTLAVPAQDGAQYRRALVVVSVADSQLAGVPSTATTDRAALEILPGALNASAGGAALPATPPNSLVLGELLIPPTGQAVQVTPYNPRTGLRGGILPVLDDASTVAGHAGAPPLHNGQYRDHPKRGLQRSQGGVWGPPVKPPATTLAEIATGWEANTTNRPRHLIDAAGLVKVNGTFRNLGAFTINATQYPLTFPRPGTDVTVHLVVNQPGIGFGTAVAAIQASDGRLRLLAPLTGIGTIPAGSDFFMDVIPPYHPLATGTQAYTE